MKKIVNDLDYFKPLGVTVQNGNIDGALKKFKTIIKDSKLIVQIKERQTYTKPSIKRKEKRMKSLYKKQLLTSQSY